MINCSSLHHRKNVFQRVHLYPGVQIVQWLFVGLILEQKNREEKNETSYDGLYVNHK
jgi:hypothetical protein